jgi:rsbT antagonist protein RsbS
VAAVPTVRVGQVLIATLGDELEDTDALAMQETISERVVTERARGVLLDISALEVVDSFICKVLSDTAHVVRVLGAEVAVVGMRPAVAITLVELGLPLTGVPTALTIDDGMALLSRRSGGGPPAGRARRA